MTSVPPEQLPDEELHHYADRLAYWAAELPSDERFAAVAIRLIEKVRETAPVAQVPAEADQAQPSCTHIVTGGPGAWVYCGWCAHQSPETEHLVWRAIGRES